MKVYKVTLDINCGVSCTLTETGMEILRNHFDYRIPVTAEKHIDPDRREIHNMPFWEFMNIFGSHLYEFRKDIPFLNNEITIVEPPNNER